MTNNDILRQEQALRSSDADLQAEQHTENEVATCPFSGHSVTKSSSESAKESLPYQYVPLRMGGNGGTHKPSEASRAIVDYEVSLEDLERMTNTFYDKAFKDFTLDKFIRSHTDPHGSRFAKWIHQKLTGSHVWDEDRRTRDLTPHAVAGGRKTVVHDRTSAHVAAWNSPKRPANEVGNHFGLDECRVWMRIHFWAMREAGIVEQSPTFADYYVRFIGHFVAVYERSATMFARDSFRWSADPKNIERYIKDGRKMNDVLGVRFQDALADLPEDEVNDEGDWPYYVADQQ